LIFSCKNTEKTTDIKETIGLTKKNEEINVTNKSIYDNLFSDIFVNPYDYAGKYSIRERQIGHSFASATSILVKSDFFIIDYRPDDLDPEKEKYIPVMVEISQKTNDILLGEYIGENSDILNSFNEIPNTKNDNLISFNNKDIYIIFHVENNIIKKIVYQKIM
jgi:hypothetical protein